MSKEINTLLEDCKVQSTITETERQESLSEVKQAIRLLEGKLIEALAGGKLRGLPEISPASSDYKEFRAARVRAETDSRIEGAEGACRYSAGEGPKVLAIAKTGHLILAWGSFEEDWDSVGGYLFEVRQKNVDDENFLITDLEALLETLQEILPFHIEKSRAAHQRFSATKLLAQNLQALFESK